jgi:hypothetical protein
MVLWIYFYTVKLSFRKFIVDYFLGIVHVYLLTACIVEFYLFVFTGSIYLEFLSVKLCVPSLMLKLDFISLKTT